MKVQVAPRRRRTALALVAVAVLARAVGVLRRGRELEEAELTDLRPRPQLDRQGRHIGKLQGDVTGETGVNETCGGVGQQAQATQRGLALQTGSNIVRKVTVS